MIFFYGWAPLLLVAFLFPVLLPVADNDDDIFLRDEVDNKGSAPFA